MGTMYHAPTLAENAGLPDRSFRRAPSRARTRRQDPHTPGESPALQGKAALTDRNSFNAKSLRRGLLGKGLGAGLGELEADEPVAGHAAAIGFGRGKGPAAGGLQSEVGEILARAGGIEFGKGDVAAGLDVDVHSDAHFALNRAARFFGDVGQDLVEDFAVSGSDGGGFRGVG